MKRVKNFLFSLALMAGIFIPVRAQAFEQDPLRDLQIAISYSVRGETFVIDRDYTFDLSGTLNLMGWDQTLDLGGHTLHFKEGESGFKANGLTLIQGDTQTIRNGTIIMEAPNVDPDFPDYPGAAITLLGSGTLILEDLTIINRTPEGAAISIADNWFAPSDQTIIVGESVQIFAENTGILDRAYSGENRTIILEGSISAKNETIHALETTDIQVRSGTYLSGGKPDLEVNRFIPEQCRGVNPVSGKVEDEQHKPLTLEGVSPTCTNEGSTAQIICSDCSGLLEESKSIEPLGHSWTDWEIKEDQAIRECLECFEVETKEVEIPDIEQPEQTEPEQPEPEITESESKPSGSLIPSGNNKPSGNTKPNESGGGNNNQTGADNETSTIPEDSFSGSLMVFKDVPDNHYAAESITYLAKNKVLNGYGDGRFGLNDLVSRGMVAQVFYNLAGNPPLAALESFEDVGECFYTQAAAFVKSKGYMTGYDSSRFGGNDPITRQDLALVLYRYSGSPIPDSLVNSYADGSEVSEYAVKAMNWAIEQGIIRGRDQKYLAPKEPTTRAEIAVILHRYLEG